MHAARPVGTARHPRGYGALQAAGLAAFRGERLVLEGVSLTVLPGEALLLLGPNGSGKSTLLRLLAGLKRPDAGTISLAGGGPPSPISAMPTRSSPG